MLDFDPLYSTSKIDAITAFITRHYAVAAPLQCKLLHRGLNDVYLVTAETGQQYVFRLSHRRARGAADVRTETEFLAHLARSGVPVAAAVPARSDALYVGGAAPEGFRKGILFNAVGGRVPNMASAQDARANGATLARIHDAAETFNISAANYRLDLGHLLHRPLTRIFDSGIIEETSVRNDFEALAVRTAAAIEAFHDLTWTFCHGDCHGMNAHISDDGEAVFFDFDDGGPGYLAYDLSVFLWAKTSFGRTLFPMWHAFVDGYRALRAIEPRDFEAAHWFVIVRHIWLMGEYASRAAEWGTKSIDWISREATFLQKWEEERLCNRIF